jgi:hypothetical protein
VAKPYLTTLASVLVLTTSLLACENSPTPVLQPGDAAGAAPRAIVAARAASAQMLGGRSIGEMHNEAMDAVLHALVRANRAGKLNPRAGCQIARAALAQYFRERGLLDAPRHRQMDDGLLNAGCKSAQERGGDGAMVLNSYAYNGAYEAIANSGLSESAKSYLYQINDAVSYGGDVWSIQDQIWSIQQQSTAVLSAVEAEIVAATASVAASSIEYWGYNFEGWYYQNGGGGGGDGGGGGGGGGAVRR